MDGFDLYTLRKNYNERSTEAQDMGKVLFSMNLELSGPLHFLSVELIKQIYIYEHQFSSRATLMISCLSTLKITKILVGLKTNPAGGGGGGGGGGYRIWMITLS
ncbi:hypothetical protein ACJX0J_017775 [Zea mays]